MSGSFELVRWNARVHRLDLGLYSHAKEVFFVFVVLLLFFFGGGVGGWGGVGVGGERETGVTTHVNSKLEKIPLRNNSLQRRIEPTRLH